MNTSKIFACNHTSLHILLNAREENAFILLLTSYENNKNTATTRRIMTVGTRTFATTPTTVAAQS